MFSDPEIIVWLWFFPIVVLIIFPLLMLIVWLLAKLPGFLTGKTAPATEVTEPADLNEKRFNTRVNIDNSMVYISDNFDRISGKISNVSLSGICIYGLPEEKLQNANKLFLRIHGEDGPFSVLVKTKWEYTQQSGKIIGAKVENAPPGWAEFVTKADRTS